MKKYIMPEMKISKFMAEEIIMTSTISNNAVDSVKSQLNQSAGEGTKVSNFYTTNWDSMMK